MYILRLVVNLFRAFHYNCFNVWTLFNFTILIKHHLCYNTLLVQIEFVWGTLGICLRFVFLVNVCILLVLYQRVLSYFLIRTTF